MESEVATKADIEGLSRQVDELDHRLNGRIDELGNQLGGRIDELDTRRRS